MSEIKSGLELSKQATGEDAKKRHGRAIRLYIRAAECYLNATCVLGKECAPLIKRAQALEEFDVDLPDMRRIHQLPLLSLLLPPWSFSSVTVSARRRICYTNDIVGIDPVKNRFSQLLKNPRSKGASSVILLYGPAGSGKSFLARGISSKYPDKPVFIVNLEAFIAAGASKYEGARMATMMVSNFKKHRTGVLILEDIDCLYSAGQAQHPQSDIVATREVIVTFLKETSEKREYHEVVVATSRKPWVLEKELLDAFHVKLGIPTPSPVERTALIKRELRKVRCPSFAESDIHNLAANTERFSCYQVMNIVRLALARNFEKLEAITLQDDADRVDHVTKSDIQAVSGILLPDIPREDADKYFEFATGRQAKPRSATHVVHFGANLPPLQGANTVATTLLGASDMATSSSEMDSRAFLDSYLTPDMELFDPRGKI